MNRESNHASMTRVSFCPGPRHLQNELFLRKTLVQTLAAQAAFLSSGWRLGMEPAEMCRVAAVVGVARAGSWAVREAHSSRGAWGAGRTIL